MFSSLRRRRITARHRQTTPRRTSPRRLRSRIPARRRTFHGRRQATATRSRRGMPGRPTRPAAVRTTAEHVPTARKRGRIRQAQAHMGHRQRPTVLAEAMALRRRTPPVRMPLLRSTTRRPLLPTIPVEAVLRTTPAVAETAAEDTPIRPADTAEATTANSQQSKAILVGGLQSRPSYYVMSPALLVPAEAVTHQRRCAPSQM